MNEKALFSSRGRLVLLMAALVLATIGVLVRGWLANAQAQQEQCRVSVDTEAFLADPVTGICGAVRSRLPQECESGSAHSRRLSKEARRICQEAHLARQLSCYELTHSIAPQELEAVAHCFQQPSTP